MSEIDRPQSDPTAALSGQVPPRPLPNNGPVCGRGMPSGLPEAIADGGQVRIGGQAPMFLPSEIADSGHVRIGGQAPLF